MTSERPVTLLQLPEKLVLGRVHLFFGEIEAQLKAERPRIVFDFSAVSQIDSAGVEMLLNSMEEVMKRNGDLKLAAIPPAPATILELTRVDRLFEIFDHPIDAVESFHRFPAHAFPATPAWNGGSAHEGGTTA